MVRRHTVLAVTVIFCSCNKSSTSTPAKPKPAAAADAQVAAQRPPETKPATTPDAEVNVVTPLPPSTGKQPCHELGGGECEKRPDCQAVEVMDPKTPHMACIDR